MLLIEVKSGKFTKNPKALFEFAKKYENEFSNIRKIVVNQTHFDYSGEIDFVPAYLLA